MAKHISTSKRVAANIAATYGIDKLRYLVNEFTKGTPGPEIAKEFGISRQRINQWKKKLGTEYINYVLDPAVEEVLRGESGSSLSRTIPLT